MRAIHFSMILGAILALLVGTSEALAGPPELILGKKAEIHLTDETQVGSLTLAPGAYLVQDETEGTEHYVKFTEHRSGYTERAKVKCTVEPLTKKCSSTKYRVRDEDGTRRLTRLEIRGENAALVF